MKKIFKLHSGFTIAELLISMLVVMVVAAAMVPIIGPKKLSVPKINKQHGIFECYYRVGSDGTTKLYQYHANNRGNNDAEAKQISGDHCTFVVPTADRYEIYAIGAGSNGYRGPENIGYDIRVDDESFHGFIPIDRFTEYIASDMSAYTLEKGILGLGTGETSLAHVMKKALNEWAQKRRNEGQDLYFAFRNIYAPLGEGGRGVSVYRRSSLEECNKLCTNVDENVDCPGPYKPEEYWSFNSNPYDKYYLTGLTQAYNPPNVNDRQCFLYVHAPGGNSAPGLKISGTVLVPVDGVSASTGGFDFQLDDYETKIMTSISGGKTGEIDLIKTTGSGDSIDASASGNPITEGTDQSVSAPWQSFADPRKVHNDQGIIKIKSGNTIRPLTKDDAVIDHNYVNPGIQGGPTLGNGGLSEPNPAKIGRIDNYTNNAFEWRYTRPIITYQYGRAGEPGEIKVMSYSNLNGTLYLYPGKNNGNSATNTVVSRLANQEDKTGYIVSAKSKTDQASNSSFEEILKPEDMPNPTQEMMNFAIANNSIFNVYISKINGSGFKGGLYGCDTRGDCPGFAGSGAYPYVDIAQFTNYLKLIDNQDLIDNGTYSVGRSYTKNSALATKTCRDNGVVKSTGTTKSYVDAFGITRDYDVKYCEPTSVRGDGGIVIIW